MKTIIYIIKIIPASKKAVFGVCPELRVNYVEFRGITSSELRPELRMNYA